MNKRDKIIISISFIWLFSCVFLIKSDQSWLMLFDKSILEFIRHNVRLTNFHKFITIFGNTNTYFYIFIPVGILMYLNKRGKTFLYILSAILISTAVVIIVKNFVGRVRPVEYFVISQGGYSFPSGHSLVSSATYWTIYRIINFKKKILNWFFIVFPLLIAFSRLALGVHWPTDVLTGLLIGYSISAIVTCKYEKDGINVL
ncbi:MAG: phosphatase PAP2 family protein [Lagierella massiliensis]|nr:phosphatase PAP2 family protein [Lagierella massiliensis]